jgi:hypothetical protein
VSVTFGLLLNARHYYNKLSSWKNHIRRLNLVIKLFTPPTLFMLYEVQKEVFVIL